MSNHRACAIIKRRSIRVVFQEGQAIKKERTRFRKQKRDDPYAWRGEIPYCTKTVATAIIQRQFVIAEPGYRGLSQTPNRGDGPCSSLPNPNPNQHW